MTISDEKLGPEEPVAVHCDDERLHVLLYDGRRISVPLWWYPRLAEATASQRAAVEMSAKGLHWDEIDEDLSIEGLLAGRKAPGAAAAKDNRAA